MKIYDKRKSKVEFSQLSPGDWFFDGEMPLMKIKALGGHNAIDTNGIAYGFAGHTEVVPFEATLIITNKSGT